MIMWSGDGFYVVVASKREETKGKSRWVLDNLTDLIPTDFRKEKSHFYSDPKKVPAGRRESRAAPSTLPFDYITSDNIS